MFSTLSSRIFVCALNPFTCSGLGLLETEVKMACKTTLPSDGQPSVNGSRFLIESGRKEKEKCREGQIRDLHVQRYAPAICSICVCIYMYTYMWTYT